MSVIGATETSATSSRSFNDAVEHGIASASKTLRNITSASVMDSNVAVSNGKVAAYRVNLAVTFVLDD